VRFFTRAWHAGELSDEEADLVETRYAEHLAALLPALPEGMRQRLTSVMLHDAQFIACTVDYRHRRVSMSLVGGDLQLGYSAIDLTYDDVAVDRLDVAALRSAVANPDTELLCDEVDAENGLFVHRFLSWPYREFDLHFRTVQLRTSAETGRLPRDREVRYVEIGAPDI
jgi:hypothetical protein